MVSVFAERGNALGRSRGLGREAGGAGSSSLGDMVTVTERGWEGLLEGGKGSWGRSPGVPPDTLQPAPTPLLEDAMARKRTQARQLEGRWTSLPRGASWSIILKHLQPKTLNLN